MQCTGGCGKELSGGLDTYGPAHGEKCWDCFNVNTDEVALAELQNELNAAKEGLEETQAAIAELESEERDIKNDIYNLEKKIKALKEPKKAAQLPKTLVAA